MPYGRRPVGQLKAVQEHPLLTSVIERRAGAGELDVQRILETRRVRGPDQHHRVVGEEALVARNLGRQAR